MTEICVQAYTALEELQRKLENAGFEFVENYNNSDTYFSILNENDVENVDYKTLLDSSLIVRHIVGDSCDIKNLVYKKKTLDENGNVIKEIKTKLKIDDIDKAKQMFSSLGLTCWCDYINHNYEYKKGEISIIVQYVDSLGLFIEIEEFNSIKDKSDKEKFAILKDIVNSLNLPLGSDFSCKKPYMYLNKTKEHHV
ncbi:MAG TPA: class IV adenylate cyclase [Candidatus Onthoplasma faecipullorum]|nr:class IV adenylate cyclase [Candidatus Onthoplasma faecipullorum]